MNDAVNIIITIIFVVDVVVTVLVGYIFMTCAYFEHLYLMKA